MILRLTQRLSKKLKITQLQIILQDGNPYADWSAHLFTAQRVHYIILTNTVSLYSMIMYGRGMSNEKNFIKGVLTYIKQFMAADGNKSIFEKYIEPIAHEISFSKITNRRVMGSMNDLIFQAKVYLVECQHSPFHVSLHLNESPMSYLKYGRPKDAFKALSLDSKK
jgi:hypothetical protein